MRILYLITRAELGGAQVHVADLVRAMRTGADVIVAAGEYGYLAEQCAALEVPFFVLKNLVQPIDPARDIQGLGEVVALIKELRPDLIHAHTSKAGLIGRLAAFTAGVPCVFTAHTWSFAEGIDWKQKALALPAEWFAGRISPRIITVSESNRARALRYRIAAAKRIVTVWNGVPDAPSRATHNRNAVPRVIMVARFAEQKDHLTLVRAAARLSAPFRLLLVGDGPTRKTVEGEVTKLGINDRVEFLGSRTDIVELLSEADVFALSTNWEGFPLTIIEAMRAQLPVIATDVDGVREAVMDGECGYLICRGDVVQFAQRLEEMVMSAQLRASMGRAARQRYEQLFSLGSMVEKTRQVYEEVMAEVQSTAEVLSLTEVKRS